MKLMSKSDIVVPSKVSKVQLYPWELSAIDLHNGKPTDLISAYFQVGLQEVGIGVESGADKSGRYILGWSMENNLSEKDNIALSSYDSVTKTDTKIKIANNGLNVSYLNVGFNGSNRIIICRNPQGVMINFCYAAGLKLNIDGKEKYYYYYFTDELKRAGIADKTDYIVAESEYPPVKYFDEGSKSDFFDTDFNKDCYAYDEKGGKYFRKGGSKNCKLVDQNPQNLEVVEKVKKEVYKQIAQLGLNKFDLQSCTYEIENATKKKSYEKTR